MIDPRQVCLYIPPELQKTKRDLFLRIASRIHAAGGASTDSTDQLKRHSDSGAIPIVGCSPQLTQIIRDWKVQGRRWIYWDRGYARRVYATWLPRGENGGYYRWHLNCFQMQEIRHVAEDRWHILDTPVQPWAKNGSHIVVAKPSRTYCLFHDIEGWLDRVIYDLSLTQTKRQLVVRDKESQRPLDDDLKGAHALVTHGSIAAVEAVIKGCPVFVDPSSAARLVGLTDLTQIETPVYPDRAAWLRSLAYSQFNEAELIDGTLWRLIA